MEVVAGVLSGSLALLSDAGHMLTDAGALGLALWAQALGTRPRSDRKTFGYRRAEILAAALNGIVLGVAAIAVIVEAARRFESPPHIRGYPMLVVAVIGLAINLLAAWILSRGSGHDLNLRAVTAHVMADAAGSVAAIVAAALILSFGWTIADPITSILISALILFGAWRLLRDATHVLMEGTPPGIDVGALERLACETPGVLEVHDMHVWSIVGDAPVITAHVLESGRSRRRGGARCRAAHRGEGGERPRDRATRGRASRRAPASPRDARPPIGRSVAGRGMRDSGGVPRTPLRSRAALS